MATVNSRTQISIDSIVNDNIVDGEIVGGHLILRSRGGAEIDAGSVEAVPSNPLDHMPVGFIYLSVVSTSPQTLFGGTWSRIAQGKVLVGQDSGQTEFVNPEDSGGEKSHVLTTGEIPGHTHSVNHDHAAFNTVSTEGNHTHVLERKTASGTSTGVVRGGATASADGTTAAGGTHVHNIDVPAFTGTSGSAGSGNAHNNLQPYLVVFMWKRVS